MQVIPAVDLRDGLVVRGQSGRRAEYRPVRSWLSNAATPAAIARGLVEKLDLTEAYVADLDAIGGGTPDWEAYDALAEAGLRLWIDAGLRGLREADAMRCFADEQKSVQGIIVGLETLPSFTALEEMLDLFGPRRLIFSLDLVNGEPLCEAASILAMRADEIATAVLDAGVRRMIVLDLARVGTCDGVGTEALCCSIKGCSNKGRSIRNNDSTVELAAGGGVQNMQDLRRLARWGCDAALVASAIYDGMIARDEICEMLAVP